MFSKWQHQLYTYYSVGMLKYIYIQDIAVRYYFRFFRNSIIRIQEFPKKAKHPKPVYHILFSYLRPIKKVLSPIVDYTNNLVEVVHHTDNEIVTSLLYTKDLLNLDQENLAYDLSQKYTQAKKQSKKFMISSVYANHVLITSLYMKIYHSFWLPSSKLQCYDIIHYFKLKQVLPKNYITDSIVVSNFYLEETVFKAKDKIEINDGYMVK